MDSFQGKTVLVTGASRGIGRAVAVELGRRGATVLVHYARDGAAAADVVAAIGDDAVALQADLGTADGPSRLAANVAEQLGGAPLDAVVSNAGAVTVGGIEELTADGFDRAMAVNVRGPLLLTRELLPLLGDGARIVTVSAAITRYANPVLLAQSAAKAALQDAVRNLAADLGPRGISVVDVAPGMVRTDLAAGLLATPGEEEKVNASTALGRVGEPEDIAGAIVALLGTDTRWITGASIDVTGGYRL
jgi:NAD(P)-dependent dehydrogenase (short-subunit alcohol dehydrogenase family)